MRLYDAERLWVCVMNWCVCVRVYDDATACDDELYCLFLSEILSCVSTNVLILSVFLSSMLLCV